MVIVDPCNPWALFAITWFDDEIKFYKLDNLHVDPKKDATFGKLENANLDPNLDCTICNNKKTEKKKNLYLKFRGFKGNIMWTLIVMQIV
jgi:hypothetical protein